MDDKLTLELLKEVKAYGKRWLIAFIIVLAMFFITNIAWLVAWNWPGGEETTTTTESYDIDQDNKGGDNNSNIGVTDGTAKDKIHKDDN